VKATRQRNSGWLVDCNPLKTPTDHKNPFFANFCSTGDQTTQVAGNTVHDLGPHRSTKQWVPEPQQWLGRGNWAPHRPRGGVLVLFLMVVSRVVSFVFFFAARFVGFLFLVSGALSVVLPRVRARPPRPHRPPRSHPHPLRDHILPTARQR